MSKALVNSNISYDEFVLINNTLKEYDDMTEVIENLKAFTDHWRFFCIYKTMLSYCSKCTKNQVKTQGLKR